jgi:hypothetical protein
VGPGRAVWERALTMTTASPAGGAYMLSSCQEGRGNVQGLAALDLTRLQDADNGWGAS